MTENPHRPERICLAPGLTVPRALTGLWQIADLERDGKAIDVDQAADALIAYADAGFDGFDMADHYGSAELISARAKQKLIARDGQTQARFFTKWCPQVSQCTPDAVRAGIQERLDRLDTDCVDLLQLHWWTFEHAGWVDMMDAIMDLKAEGKIAHIGLTNVDADHLHLMLCEGYEIASNQVSMSVLDRRGAGELSRVCLDHDVKLLAYGTLAGGFLSDKWLGASEPIDIPDWPKMKYKRFIDSAGGWDNFQAVLEALSSVAKKHNVSVSNVATRWVMEHEAVGSVIVGARLLQSEHIANNALLSSFELTSDDHQELNEILDVIPNIPGDCGDEYRKPPFLTASGDLSHHLDALPNQYDPVEVRPGRWRLSSDSVWEGICGFSRATKVGNRILVSGTTATHGSDRCIGGGDVRSQTVYILDKIIAAVRAFGGSPEDIIRTRIYLRDAEQWEAVSRVHGRYFATALPANTLIEVSNLVGDYDVEIEAEAELTLAS
jgi:aryl-alcohol dehydrogenase-like predicted oxidoreductase/enamine deaminase RidA (YjgF/YER057c/UK114 family)